MNLYKWSLIALVVAAQPVATAAEPYFVECQGALLKPAFAPLDALLRRDNTQQLLREPYNCMALAPPREYLVTTYNQLYYCDTVVGRCVAHDDSSYYPNLTVVRQFSGKNNKQYVLFSASGMRSGRYSSGYHVFNLVPKRFASRGYVFYSLGIGEMYGDEFPCDELQASEEALRLNTFQLLGEGTIDVEIMFQFKVTSCQTGLTASRSVRFRLKDGKFSTTVAAAPRQ